MFQFLDVGLSVVIKNNKEENAESREDTLAGHERRSKDLLKLQPPTIVPFS
jgi:hypothetical protein